MLSSSVDLLKEFALQRQQGLATGQGSDADQGQGLGQGMDKRTMSSVPGAVGGEGQVGQDKSQEKGQGMDLKHDDNGVGIQEDMLLEIHLAKPSKPPKVAKPTDFSLRAALQRAQGELGEMGSPGTSVVTHRASPPLRIFTRCNYYYYLHFYDIFYMSILIFF